MAARSEIGIADQVFLFLNFFLLLVCIVVLAVDRSNSTIADVAKLLLGAFVGQGQAALSRGQREK